MNSENVKMKILAVSNELSVLAELSDVLKKLFPVAEVVTETDPLMACKYSFNNKVSLVFAAVDMKRMSGPDLVRFIKREHPSVKTYLIYDSATCSVASVCDDSDGAIRYPFSEEELTAMLELNFDDIG